MGFWCTWPRTLLFLGTNVQGRRQEPHLSGHLALCSASSGQGSTPSQLVTETVIDQPRINQERTAFTDVSFYSNAHEVEPFLHRTRSGSESPALAHGKNPGMRPAVLSGAQSPTPAAHPCVPGTGTRWLYVGMLCPYPTLYTTFQGAH